MSTVFHLTPAIGSAITFVKPTSIHSIDSTIVNATVKSTKDMKKKQSFNFKPLISVK